MISFHCIDGITPNIDLIIVTLYITQCESVIMATKQVNGKAKK